MRILVTGATGFVGRHLVAALSQRPDVVVQSLSRSGPLAVDLLDRDALIRTLAELRPDRIAHLAGFASPGQSFHRPLEAWAGNLTATVNLYEAVVAAKLRPRILFVGTGQVYGDQPTDVPLTEDASLRPNNPYAASKAAADLASFQYFANPGLEIIRARPFNHIGPGQSAEYAIANFARQVAAIAQGRQPAVIETGNLQPRRDLTDVRDIVAAYLALLDHGEPGQAYNIASGKTVTMQEVLDRLIELGGVRVEVRPRADLVRAVDLSVPRVDTSRLVAATNWRATVPIDQTLTEVLEAWRSG